MIQVQTGVSSPIFLRLFDGATSKFPRADVRKEDGTPVVTVDLTHQANGRYVGAVTFPANGYYYVDFTVYDDFARTIESLIHTETTDLYLAETPVDIANAVWDAPTLAHVLPGSFGAANAFLPFECALTAAIDPELDILDIQVWLNKNNAAVLAPTTAQVLLYNSIGGIVLTLTSSTPSAVGVFNMTSAVISGTLAANQTYTALITITVGADSFNSTKALQVF
jgi:hypothetical protein